MTVELRPYSSADAAATRGAFVEAIRRTAAAHYMSEQLAAWAGGADDLVAWNTSRSAAWTVVAVVDGRVVGFSDLTADGVLDMLYVHPDAGGRGVARALIETVLDEAREHGASRATRPSPHLPHPPFARLGFTLDAENPSNRVRGVVVPNCDMSIELHGAVRPGPRHGTATP